MVSGPQDQNKPIPLTIVIPVGPRENHRLWLGECLDSIFGQTTPAGGVVPEIQVLLIDDMAFVSPDFAPRYWGRFTIHRNPWLLGCASSWNIGVALAQYEHVLLMSSDDKLELTCLYTCMEEIKQIADPKGYYGMACHTSEGEEMRVFNNAAIVTRSLWKWCGGFPLSGAVGAPDALLVSILLKNAPQHLHMLSGGPKYWVRVHDQQDTRYAAAFFHGEVLSVRNRETERFKPPEWSSRVS